MRVAQLKDILHHIHDDHVVIFGVEDENGDIDTTFSVDRIDTPGGFVILVSEKEV